VERHNFVSNSNCQRQSQLYAELDYLGSWGGSSHLIREWRSGSERLKMERFEPFVTIHEVS